MSVQLIESPREHFQEMVEAGIEKVQIKAPAAVRVYLVDMLEHYLDTQNLYPPEVSESGARLPTTLAEMWLTAGQIEGLQRFELLKQLADKSLYISGFFSDSLQRKIVDIDYYAELGCAAYATLAEDSKQDLVAQVFKVFSRDFLGYVDVLSYISQKTMIQSDQNLLRLYDRYLMTGSEVAKDRLLELGVVNLPTDSKKKNRQ